MERDLLTFLDLDIDDRLTKAYLTLGLDNNLTPSLRITYINYVLQRIGALKPSQQLRVLDYLIYALWEVNENPYRFLKNFRTSSDVLHSLTLISIYKWSVVSVIDYFTPAKYNLVEGIIRRLKGELPEVNTVERFLREEIEEVGFDNAHLELLLVLDFISRLRDRGYKGELKATYLGIIIDTNAPPELQKEIKEGIIEEYKRLYNADVRNFVDSIYGMVMSLDDFQEYVNKVLGKST